MKRTFLIYLLLVLTQGYYAQVWAETKYVDLGLPSGTKWAVENEEREYTFYEAVSVFPRQVPTIEQFIELQKECIYKADKDGVLYIGRNGNTIFMPWGKYQFIPEYHYLCLYMEYTGIEARRIRGKSDSLFFDFVAGDYSEWMHLRLVQYPDTMTTPKICNHEIDLKLPSGAKWMAKNGEEELLSSDTIFGPHYSDGELPLVYEWQELLHECKWNWTGFGYQVSNKNGDGQTLYIPVESHVEPQEPADYIFSHYKVSPYRYTHSLDVDTSHLETRLVYAYGNFIQRSPFEYVDMGLPSGTLWGSYSIDTTLTWPDALDTYGKQVPSKEQYIELLEHSTINYSGYTSLEAISPNGNKVLLGNSYLWTRSEKDDKSGVYGVMILENSVHFFVDGKQDSLSVHLVK